MTPVLVTNASQIVWCRPDGQVVTYQDGFLLCEKGMVSAVGPWEEIKPLVQAGTEELDATGCCVTPGLVDAHTHAVFAGCRVGEFEQRCAGDSYEQIARAGGGIQSTVRSTRAASEAELLAETERHMRWMASCGTTTVEVKSGYGLDVKTEVRQLKVAAAAAERVGLKCSLTYLGLHSVGPEFAGDPAGYADFVIDEGLPAAKEAGATWCDAFCESIAFDRDICRRALAAAKEAGFGLRLHVDQLGESGGAALAAELGAKTADHLEHTGAGGIAALSKAGVVPVLLPGSVYALGHTKYPDARAMLDAGLPVVLATDFNPGSSPTPSLPMVMSLACTQMQMSPAECLAGCTVNAAASLNMAAGSLERGALADFVVWDALDFREICYWFGSSLAKHVYAGGRRIAGSN